MSDNRSIGIFDSGLGGLTVVKEILKILPNEDVIYLGDTARVPYGTRSGETIIQFSLEDAAFLLKRKVKCIVIACNTSSAYASKTLKNKLEIPVFDVISPALKEAKKISKGKIGVIGTRGTINSKSYKVDYSVGCPLLVPFIEEGDINSKALKLVLQSYIKPFKGKISTLILGCTHYPIIEKMIQKEIGISVKLVNPEKTVVGELSDFLSKNNMLNNKNTKGKKEFYVTDLTDRFTKVAEMFLGEKIKGNLVKITL